MAKKGKRNPSREKSGIQGTNPGGTKLDKVSATPRKGGNTGGTHEGGDHQVQGASHQGSSLGKRNSG